MNKCPATIPQCELRPSIIDANDDEDTPVVTVDKSQSVEEEESNTNVVIEVLTQDSKPEKNADEDSAMHTIGRDDEHESEGNINGHRSNFLRGGDTVIITPSIL